MRYGCDISLKYDFGSGVPCVGVIQLGHIYAANKKLGVTGVQLSCGRKKLDSDLESFFQATFSPLALAQEFVFVEEKAG